MTRLERILACAAIVAVALKSLLVPGSGLLAVLSFTLLSILYFPLGFATLNNVNVSKIFYKRSYAGLSTMRIIGTVAFGMALSGIVTGILFKIQFYPTANMSLASGITIAFIVGIVAFIRYLQVKSEYYRKIIIKTFVFGILGLLLLMTSRYSLMKLFHRNDPELIQE